VGFQGLLTRQGCAKVSALVAVPALLALIDWLTRRLQSNVTEFLLVPPLAVVIFLLFSQPDARFINARSIIVLPVLGAAVGEACYAYFGLTPWGIGAATLIILLAQEAIRGYMPPALAIAILAMLLKARGIGYTAGVGLAVLLIGAVFVAWRTLVWSRLPADGKR
jgi:CBS-domain-containing membrane protein